MDKKDKNNVAYFIIKHIELSQKKISDAEGLSEVFEEIKAMSKECTEPKRRLAKRKMIVAFLEWYMYSLDKFTKLEEEVTKELKVFENSNPDRDPSSSYPQNFDEKLKKMIKEFMKIFAVTRAFMTINIEGENWEELFPLKRD
jgi:hypothetical protein